MIAQVASALIGGRAAQKAAEVQRAAAEHQNRMQMEIYNRERYRTVTDKIATDPLAFWLNPDWSGGDNLRDKSSPFWMREPVPFRIVERQELAW